MTWAVSLPKLRTSGGRNKSGRSERERAIMEQAASIFLSHSHKDKPFVRRLARDLESRGVRVWIDEAEMMIGDSLVAKIGAAIDSMAFVGAVLSRHSVESPWVTRELEIALNHEIAGRRVKVLPLVIDECIIPPFLVGKLYGDFRGGAQYQDSLELLMRRLSGGRAQGDSVSGAGGNRRAIDSTGRAGPFEMRLLQALHIMRPMSENFAAEGHAQRFLDALADVGNVIQGSPSSFLIYRSSTEFLDAYNAVAALAGKDFTLSPHEMRRLMEALLLAIDELSIEVGIQGLRTQYAGDREQAARILGDLGAKAEPAVSPLRRTLKDSSGPVRTAAAWALTAIGTEEAQRAVRDYEGT